MSRSLLILLLFLVPVVLYAQEPVTLLDNVNISADSNVVAVKLDFNGPVSFTSMKLSKPYRIVLDFVDCKKGRGVKNSMKVDSDGVKEISISQMGSGSAPVLRVSILTSVDLEFNVEPTDNGVNVKIAGVRLAQKEVTPKSQETENMTEVTSEREGEVMAEAQAEPVSAPVVEERAEAQAEPVSAPVVEERAEAQAEPVSAPVVEERAEAQAEPVPAPVAEEKAEAQAEPVPAPVAEEKAEAQAESVSAPVVEERAEAQAEPVEESRSRKFKEAPAKVASDENVQATRDLPQHIETSKRRGSSRNSMRWLGFQVSANSSRVFVKTAYEAEYSIREKEEKTVVLEIYNTDIPKKNNRRPLDTSFFNSPVVYISPHVEGGPMKVVKIEIKLSRRVPFVTKQESNAIYIDFEGTRE